MGREQDVLREQQENKTVLGDTLASMKQGQRDLLLAKAEDRDEMEGRVHKLKMNKKKRAKDNEGAAADRASAAPNANPPAVDMSQARPGQTSINPGAIFEELATSGGAGGPQPGGPNTSGAPGRQPGQSTPEFLESQVGFEAGTGAGVESTVRRQSEVQKSPLLTGRGAVANPIVEGIAQLMGRKRTRTMHGSQTQLDENKMLSGAEEMANSIETYKGNPTKETSFAAGQTHARNMQAAGPHFPQMKQLSQNILASRARVDTKQRQAEARVVGLQTIDWDPQARSLLSRGTITGDSEMFNKGLEIQGIEVNELAAIDRRRETALHDITMDTRRADLKRLDAATVAANSTNTRNQQLIQQGQVELAQFKADTILNPGKLAGVPMISNKRMTPTDKLNYEAQMRDDSGKLTQFGVANEGKLIGQYWWEENSLYVPIDIISEPGYFGTQFGASKNTKYIQVPGEKLNSLLLSAKRNPYRRGEVPTEDQYNQMDFFSLIDNRVKVGKNRAGQDVIELPPGADQMNVDQLLRTDSPLFNTLNAIDDYLEIWVGPAEEITSERLRGPQNKVPPVPLGAVTLGEPAVTIKDEYPTSFSAGQEFRKGMIEVGKGFIEASRLNSPTKVLGTEQEAILKPAAKATGAFLQGLVTAEPEKRP